MYCMGETKSVGIVTAALIYAYYTTLILMLYLFGLRGFRGGVFT